MHLRRLLLAAGRLQQGGVSSSFGESLSFGFSFKGRAALGFNPALNEFIALGFVFIAEQFASLGDQGFSAFFSDAVLTEVLGENLWGLRSDNEECVEAFIEEDFTQKVFDKTSINKVLQLFEALGAVFANLLFALDVDFVLSQSGR